MIFVGANERREVWFDTELESFVDKDKTGKLALMGRVDNFVFPHIARPQDMNDYLARKVTLFAKRWIDEREVAA